jgi:hypothetical protein
MNLSVLSDPGAADNPVKSDHVAPLLQKYKLPVEITILTTFRRMRSARSPNPPCGNGSPAPTYPATRHHP